MTLIINEREWEKKGNKSHNFSPERDSQLHFIIIIIVYKYFSGIFFWEFSVSVMSIMILINYFQKILGTYNIINRRDYIP